MTSNRELSEHPLPTGSQTDSGNLGCEARGWNRQLGAEPEKPKQSEPCEPAKPTRPEDEETIAHPSDLGPADPSGAGRLLEPGSGRLPALSPWKRLPRRGKKSRRAKGVPGATRSLLP